MSEEKTIADLMAKRFKVIANYLFSPYKIGDIIKPESNYTQSVKLAVIPVTAMGEGYLQECFYDINDCDNYPALFKEIYWSEERSLDEMPKYLKIKGNQNWVFRVIKYLLPYDVITPDEEVGTFKDQLLNFIPATEQEYLNYIENK